MHRPRCVASARGVPGRGRPHLRLHVPSSFLLESGDSGSVSRPEKSQGCVVPAQGDESVLRLGGAWRLRGPSEAASLGPVSLPAQRAGQRTEGESPRLPVPSPGPHAPPGPHARSPRHAPPGPPPRREPRNRAPRSACTAVLAGALTLSSRSRASKLIALLQSHTTSKVTAKLGNDVGFLWGPARPLVSKTRTKKCGRFGNTACS